eukprot:352807-Chlamydomonas_euryale.AAC.2
MDGRTHRRMNGSTHVHGWMSRADLRLWWRKSPGLKTTFEEQAGQWQNPSAARHTVRAAEIGGGSEIEAAN